MRIPPLFVLGLPLTLIVILVIAFTHWLAYTLGQSDVRQNTIVVEHERNSSFGPYYGKCTRDFRYCAVDQREDHMGIAKD